LGHPLFEFYASGNNHQGDERDEIVENVNRIRKVFYIKAGESYQDKGEKTVQDFYIIALSLPMPEGKKNQGDCHELSYENPQFFFHPTDLGLE
jgi:hypothetical protein